MIEYLMYLFNRLAGRRDADLPTNPRTIALVGNGEVDSSCAHEIDAADIVVRFNRASSCGSTAGRRTDILVLVNAGEPGQSFVKKPRLINGLARKGANEFLLVIDPEDIPVRHAEGNENAVGDVTARLLISIVKGQKYSFLPLSSRRETARLLTEHGGKPDVMPSSGALAVQYFRKRYPGAALQLHGFTHQGWGGHDWAAEKAWISSVLAEQNAGRAHPDEP